MNDRKFAFRQLLKNPGFTAVAVLTLALGIGANTAIFSVVNAVLFRRLPFPDADRLVLIGETNDRGEAGRVSPANFLDRKEQSQLFEEMGAKVDWGGYELTGDPEPEQVIGAPVSASMFRLLKVQPLLKRTFSPEEDQPGGPAVVLLSRQLWQRRFSGDPGIIGRALTLNGKPRSIIGVMPAGFYFNRDEVMLSETDQLWVPLAQQLVADGLSMSMRNTQNLSVWAPGVGLLFAFWGIELLSAIVPETVRIPRLDQLVIDGRVLAFTLLAAVLAGVMFGLAPASQSLKTNVQLALTENSRGSTSGVRGRQFGGVLVVSQITLALMLLIGAGLLIRSFLELQRVNPGINPQNVLTLRIPAPDRPENVDPSELQRREAFVNELLQRLQSMPGVQAVGLIDSKQPVAHILTMEEVLSHSVSPQRFNMVLIGLLACIALLLAAAGIYGVIAYSVAQRTQEIGVRMALGAQKRNVLSLVIGQGMRLVSIGILIGVLAALALTLVMSSLLYEVKPNDPLTFAGVSLLLAGIAFLACWLPARRATKVDPMEALRHE